MAILALLLALPPQVTSTPQAPRPSFVRADLDGDGIDDLLLPHPTGTRLLLGLRQGGFAPAQDGTLPHAPGEAAECRDVDADGDLDVLIWGIDGGHLLRNDEGLLQDVSEISGFAARDGVLQSIQWVDLDGDGVEDLLLSTDRSLVGRRNLGGGRFAALEMGITPSPSLPTPVPGLAPGVVDDGVEPNDSTPKEGTERTKARRTPVASPPGVPTSPSSAGIQSGPVCASSIEDAIQGGCLQASATPTLGMLMPLSTDFNLDTAGNVGIGTTNPTAKLDVAGDLHASGVLRSDALGTAPLVVQSSTLVQNLNADLLDGKQASQFTQLGASIEGSEVTDGTLTDADLSAGAAIAGTKVAPDFGAQNVTTTGLLSVGTASPLGRAHFQNNDLGLTASHLSGEAVTLESSDAYLGLVGSSGGQFGSGLTLREVTAGALADVWAMIRETNASGSDLRFTYGSNVAPHLNSTVLGLTADGKVGIGTSSPAVSLDIPTGADAALSGGGYVQLGSSSGLNMLLDDNELIARNGTRASTLHLNHDGGNVTVSASGTGNLGIGVSNPTAKLHVGGATGDGSVILPSSAISAGEMMDEPGISSSKDSNANATIPVGSWNTIASSTLSAPTPGYVVAIARADVSAGSTIGTYWTQLDLTAGGSSDTDALFQQLASDTDTVFVQDVLRVSRAGSFTVNLKGKNLTTYSPASSRVDRVTLTLMFFPTAYGTVQ